MKAISKSFGVWQVLTFAVIDLAWFESSNADFWATPSSMIVSSEGGSEAYQIVPRKSDGKVEASAFYLLTEADGAITRVNERALVTFPRKVILPGGNYFITFDSWFDGSGDHALVIYRAGRLQWDFSLDRLIALSNQALLGHLEYTMSWTWWRNSAKIEVHVPWDHPGSPSRQKDFEKATLSITYPDGLSLTIALASGRVDIKTPH